ncbi:MAG: helix-turn-helix domain-containing protein [Planctomycetota bacterium]
MSANALPVPNDGADRDLQPLVQFALRHMIVKTNVCSRQKMEHGYLLQNRTVPDWNLIFVTRGQVVWVIAGVEQDLAPGDLVLVPPAVEHHAFSRTQRVTLESLHVEVTLPGGRDLFELIVPPRRQTVPARSRLDRYLRGALAEYDRPQPEVTRAVLPFWSPLILHELLRDNDRRGLLTCRDEDPLILGMLEELNRRIEQPTTLDELAAKAGFSAQHLNRVFRRRLGLTPLQYLLRMRLEQAAVLLRDNRRTVRGVAEAVGFDDPYYFSRMFRQQFGRSPAQYRAEQGSDSPS